MTALAIILKKRDGLHREKKSFLCFFMAAQYLLPKDFMVPPLHLGKLRVLAADLLATTETYEKHGRETRPLPPGGPNGGK
ncbi:hypothetical protein SAMN02745823_02498 [Sporobacter termitidis DSM 10068]|uniref:Uncharacterized protein n=1 Tax=Sporobacter termitidis DSM 10068 TaxID=1123282 RepID=A0A1M5YG19_9FIRM|nr:hypothetical protein SAMN02745823_02498 [Sporobacter termitidis DSM 10068]